MAKNTRQYGKTLLTMAWEVLVSIGVEKGSDEGEVCGVYCKRGEKYEHFQNK